MSADTPLSGKSDTYQVAGETKGSAERAVSESLPQLIHDVLGDTATVETLLRGVERGQTHLGASLGNKDLVLRHMCRRCMVFSMSDAPRVEWDSETVGSKDFDM